MKNARRAIVATLLMAIVTTMPADTVASGDSSVQAVWNRALTLTNGSERWLPGQTMMTMEFLNRKGETDEVLKMLTEVTQGDSGLVIEITELERPGGLIGAMMPRGAFGSDANSSASSSQPQQRDAEEGEGNSELIASPFLPEVQESLVLESAGESRYFEGMRAEAYAISWVAADDTSYDGTIWLVDETGGPALMEVVGNSAQPNVKSLSVSVAYSQHGDKVLADTAITSMEMTFALLIKVRMRMTLDFADYFETDGDQEFTVVGADNP